MVTVDELAQQAIREAREAGVPEGIFHDMCNRLAWAVDSGWHNPDATVAKAVLEIIKPLLPALEDRADRLMTGAIAAHNAAQPDSKQRYTLEDVKERFRAAAAEDDASPLMLLTAEDWLIAAFKAIDSEEGGDG